MRIILFSLLMIGLTACQDEEKKIIATIPSVKIIEVNKLSSGQIRKISGKVEAQDKAQLAFPIGGTVKEILADPGQSVNRSQILARLDPQTYNLAVSSAKARLSSARATMAKEKENLNRQSTLFKKELVTKAALDNATAAFSAAEAQVKTARSDLDKALRDVEKTALVAPFDGIIAEKKVDAFQEVTPGSPIFVLQGNKGLLVKVLVPETIIKNVTFGQPVSISFPSIKKLELGGSVSEISNQAEAGNAFPVSIRIAKTEVDIRPGITAQVQFNLTTKSSTKAYLIPVSAIALQDAPESVDSKQTYDNSQPTPVYVLKDGSVRKKMVKIRGLRGNDVEVTEGLEPGDKVIVAGVAFLRDGMKAKQWKPDL